MSQQQAWDQQLQAMMKQMEVITELIKGKDQRIKLEGEFADMMKQMEVI